MTHDVLGRFDHVIAMDSLIYYGHSDLTAVLTSLARRSPAITFTVAPRTRMLVSCGASASCSRNPTARPKWCRMITPP